MLAGGIVSNTVISGGGIEIVSSGGSALESVVGSGGTERIEAGGQTSALLLEGGGMLDIASLPFGAGMTTLGFVSSGTGGTLTVTDGGTSLSVALFGQYVAGGFALSSDGDGGTLVTYGPVTMVSAGTPSLLTPTHEPRPGRPIITSPPSHLVSQL